MVRPSPGRAIALAALAATTWSCDPLSPLRACTLVGCDSGVRVSLDPGAALPYTATAAWAGGSASFTCSRDGGGARPVPPYSFAVFCDETGFFIGCSAPELQSLCRSSEVELTVLPSGGPARRLRQPLRFTAMYPNGRECDRDPVCRQAGARVP